MGRKKRGVDEPLVPDLVPGPDPQVALGPVLPEPVALSITERALVEYAQEPKLKGQLCKEPDCTKNATRKDGRCAKHSGWRLTSAAEKAYAQERIKRKANFYLAQHALATKIAAKQGDAKPAQWALERIGVVEPPEPKGGEGGPRVIVQIGAILPGLKEGI